MTRENNCQPRIRDPVKTSFRESKTDFTSSRHSLREILKDVFQKERKWSQMESLKRETKLWEKKTANLDRKILKQTNWKSTTLSNSGNQNKYKINKHTL